MTATVRVTIVRPERSASDIAIRVAAGLVVLALNAWALMLVASTLTDWHLGYWDTLLVLLAARLLQRGPDYISWTRGAKS